MESVARYDNGASLIVHLFPVEQNAFQFVFNRFPTAIFEHFGIDRGMPLA